MTRRDFCGSSLALAAMGMVPSVTVASDGGKRWYKGMLHCHCYWSDGRAFPEQGAKAYRDRGYHFYCMSDHNRLGKDTARWRDVCEDEGPWPKNGKLLYGIASDDAHWYPDSGTPQNPFPFADGYIQVRAEELTPEALVAAMDRGDFYASCGVDLEDVRADPERGRLTVSVPAKDGVAYTIRFVGTRRDFDADVRGTVRFAGNPAQSLGVRDYPLYSDGIGVDFKSVSGRPGERVEATYALGADELYVRAVVESSEPVTGYAKTSHQHPRHRMAWTQPLRQA